jgi:hypothetical protein
MNHAYTKARIEVKDAPSKHQVDDFAIETANEETAHYFFDRL